ncbi:Arabinogalactan peptide [Macleaya cordata]|uniref:Arabinogalactan peptide n=1 Tax=Macleaya cordata TaxID=56857 RepID=A0A200QLS5_MACCD|nr:Arabinogalactan peptide [Macleaya cordata]
MELVRVTFTTMAVLALLVALVFPAAINAQSPEPAMAPSSDGVAIDQGIAYVLMLAALVLTYIIH